MITILVLAATPVARAGLRALLADDPVGDLRVVGEATGSGDLLAQIAACQPDCLLVDPDPIDAALLDTLAELTRTEPGRPVVLLGPAGPDTGREALRSGARASLRLAAGGPELAVALRAVMLGLVVLDPATAGPLLDQLTDQQARLITPDTPPTPLTRREREVLQLLAQGHTNRGIAAQLGVSEHTAKFHVGAVLAKLGVGSRAEAVAVAARQGLILV